MIKKYLDYNGLVRYHNNLQAQTESNNKVIAAALNDLDFRNSKVNDWITTNENLEANLEDVNDLSDFSDPIISNTELIRIHLKTSLEGVSMEGHTINVYYDDDETQALSVVTNTMGLATLKIPLGNHYRIVFPVIEGLERISDIEDTALLVWKAIEVEYTDRREKVEIHVQEHLRNNTTLDSEEVSIQITIDGVTTSYITDENGRIDVNIPYGTTYTIKAPNRVGFYIKLGEYTRTYTAGNSSRPVDFMYREWTTGLFFVDSSGNEYTMDQMEVLIDNFTINPQDIRFIAVKTDTLLANNGQFIIDVDIIRARGTSMQWASSNTAFNSIPLNGQGASASYYYDGLSASRLIQEEGDERGINTPAVDQCLTRSIEINSEPHQGFLGALGQWAELWPNRLAVDEMIMLIRPLSTTNQLLSTYTTSKWTSTQGGASAACNWASSVNSYGKNGSSTVVPFFAY